MFSTEAETLIQDGIAPSGLRVSGHIDLSGKDTITTLPSNLTVDVLSLDKCTGLTTLPPGLHVRRLILDGCTGLKNLPFDLKCNELQWRNCHWHEWTSPVTPKNSLDLSDSPNLKVLPENLTVSKLQLNNCTGLSSLPEGIDVCFLDMRGCVDLNRWPKIGHVHIGRLNVRDCMALTRLPDWLTQIGQLDLRGCRNITKLPENLQITSWVDIGGSGIRSVPETVNETCLRWRSAPIDKHTLLNADKITAQEVLNESNVERRRVLLDLMGYEGFFEQAHAVELDSDRDTGGDRKLLKVAIPNDEDLVCVCVTCPSTDKRYVIRVPPSMKTCRQAAAWIAGFDRAEDYVLIKET